MEITKELLVQLGIDPDEIKSQVVSEAAEIVAKEIDYEIKKHILKTAEDIVAKKINKMVEETLSGKYQAVDDYGEAKGKATTLRDQFKQACISWWEVTVDKEGKTSTGYYGTKRYEWVAQKVVYEVLTSNLKIDFAKMIAETREALKQGISKVITDEMQRIWDIKPKEKQE
jgi:hypothetical protein